MLGYVWDRTQAVTLLRINNYQQSTLMILDVFNLGILKPETRNSQLVLLYLQNQVDHVTSRETHGVKKL
jgi:hypothetical protein